MWPRLGEWDQIGCISQYENLCSYIYSSIYPKKGLKQQHSWTQEQPRTLLICSMQRNCTSPLNSCIDHDQFTMWMEQGIRMGILSTTLIWKCRLAIKECGSGSSSQISLIKRLSWDTLGLQQCSQKLIGLEVG